MMRVTIRNGKVSRKLVLFDAPFPAKGDTINGEGCVWTVIRAEPCDDDLAIVVDLGRAWPVAPRVMGRRCENCGQKIDLGTVHLIGGQNEPCDVRVYGTIGICQCCRKRRKLRRACGQGVCRACDASFVVGARNDLSPMVTV